MKHYDILIIGAGAAGLAAAVAARTENETCSIAVLDKNDKAGRKIYATGNGRCNLSNQSCAHVTKVLSFFDNLGLSTVTKEEGRIYPASLQAADVVYVLTEYLIAHDVDLLLRSQVTEIEKESDGFVVTTEKGKLSADKVLLATGGKAGPQYGTTGDGYGLAKSLGHTVSATYPILTGLETAITGAALNQDFSMPDGVRCDATVTLYRKEEACFVESGQVQFTKYGVSGIVIFNASRHVRLSGDTTLQDYTLGLDLATGVTAETLTGQIENRLKQGIAPLRSTVPMPLSELIVTLTTMEQSDSDSHSLETMSFAGAIAAMVKNFPLQVTGVRGWKNAQATGGGIVGSEWSEDTFASKCTKGLYLAGEILDVDGPCGGYNLQHAWYSGMTAGRAMAHDL